MSDAYVAQKFFKFEFSLHFFGIRVWNCLQELEILKEFEIFLFWWSKCHWKNILSISILGIERNRTGPNHVNTADDSTHRLDFEPKIDEQWVRCDSVHYPETETIFGSNTTDSGHQTLQNFEIICASNCLVSWNEFPVDNSFAIEECNELFVSC